MPSRPDDSTPAAAPDTPSIAKWTRVYAQNRRSLAVAVFLALYACLTAAMGGLSYLAGSAYRSDNMTLFVASILALIPVTAGIVYLAIPCWGGRLLDRVVQRHYAKEGNAAFSPPGESAKFWGPILAACLGVCVVASVKLDFAYDIPARYSQPISALYVVPFLVGMWLLMRPMAGYLTLLWPALYATHAILIVAGAPIFFSGPWQVLNIFLPMAGYGLLTAMIGYAYSRVAWHRLKALARVDDSAARGLQEDAGP